ncbi:MAG: transglycosylase domain-containing protein, partial [Paludibacteraceae bacterium]|nr:transglycosylase domain-containing protein [Paludibacteraceae bacterium]
MKKLLYFIITIFVLIALAVGAVFIFSDTIMKKVLDKELGDVRDKYGVQVKYEGLKFNDLSSMTFNGISLYKVDADKNITDTIATVDSLTATAQLRSLMKKKLKLVSLRIVGVDVAYKMKSHRSDADSVEVEADNVEQGSKKNIYEKFNQATGLFFRMMPERFSLTDFNLSVESDSFYAKIAVPRFQIKDDKFESDVICQEMTHEIQNLSLTGTYQRNDQTITADIQSNSDTARVIVPFIEYKYGAKIAANIFFVKVSVDADESAGLFKIRGNASAEYLSIYHERLSAQTLNCGSPSSDFLLNIDKNSIELDSSTVVRLEKLEFSPYVKLDKGDNFGLTIKLNKDRFPADNLFSSIPRGLMPSLEGIKVEGDIDYHLLFSFDMDNIDSLQFASSMKKYPGFKITKFGNVDLRKMQDTFTYLAYDQNVLQRKILVSETNPNYRKLDDISVYLRNAVLFSEDPSFFRHRGFLESALRESMIKNIKEKRFARGGSTISMQLVKNVFLNRE